MSDFKITTAVQYSLICLVLSWVVTTSPVRELKGTELKKLAFAPTRRKSSWSVTIFYTQQLSAILTGNRDD